MEVEPTFLEEDDPLLTTVLRGGGGDTAFNSPVIDLTYISSPLQRVWTLTPWP